MLVIVRYQTASNYGPLPEYLSSPSKLRSHLTRCCIITKQSPEGRTGEGGPLRRTEKGAFFALLMNEFAHVISRNNYSVELQSGPIGFYSGISSQGTHWLCAKVSPQPSASAAIVRAFGIPKSAPPMRMIGMQWPSRSRSVCRSFGTKGSRGGGSGLRYAHVSLLRKTDD